MGKKNILLFCSDSKGKAVLVNIVRTLKSEYLDKFNFLFMYSDEKQLQYPTQDKQKFRMDCDDDTLSNWDTSDLHSNSLNMKLPWKPDFLVIQRERWQPEQSIIQEFHDKWNTHISCVEVNSQIVNSYETQFEMLSRLNYPQNLVNTFFEGSEWTSNNRKLMLGSDWDKNVVVGNPRFDGNPLYTIKENVLDDIKREYNIDDRKNIFVWSLINNTRPKLLDILNNLSKNIDHTKYKIFFKPYPGEPTNERFKHQFNGNTIIHNGETIDNISIIYNDSHTFPLVDLSDIHLVNISSAVLFPLSFNKDIVNIENKLGGLNYLTDINIYTNEDNNGVEDSAKFWMSVFNLDSKEKFIKLVEQFDTDVWKQKNELILESFNKHIIEYDDELSFLDNIVSDTTKQNNILKYYDEYSDGKSSNRILDYLYSQI
jgi:hypothetical protein